jgi:hypothetical protein
MMLEALAGITQQQGAGGEFNPETDITWHSLLWMEGTKQANRGFMVFLPNTSGNYIQTPPAAALDLTSDLGIVVRLGQQDRTPSGGKYLVTKQGAADFTYAFGISATGQPFVVLSTDGTESKYTATASPSYTDAAAWLGVTWDQSSGDIKFWDAQPYADTPTWSQIGTTVTGPTGTLTTNSEPVEINSYSEGTAGRGGGFAVYRNVQIFDGIGANTAPDQGTSVADLRFRYPLVDSGTSGSSIGIDPDGNDWSAYGTAWLWRVVELLNETGESDLRNTSSSGEAISFEDAAFNSKTVIDFRNNSYFRTSGGFLVDPSYTSGVSIIAIGSTDLPTTNQALCGGESNQNNIAISGSQWAIDAGTEQAAGTPDTSAHLFIAFFDGSASNDTLSVDGTGVIDASAGSQMLDGLTAGNRQQFGSPRWDGRFAFLGVYEGDITADGKFSALKTWVTDHYGITVA